MKNMIRVGIFVLLGFGINSTMFAQTFRSEAELEQKIAQLEDELDAVRENSDGNRRVELKERLKELRSVDKRDLSTNEKKALRREKREVTSELEQIDGVNQSNFHDPWLYPYGRFGRFNRFGYGFHPRGLRARRVYVRRPVCVARPARVRS